MHSLQALEELKVFYTKCELARKYICEKKVVTFSPQISFFTKNFFQNIFPRKFWVMKYGCVGLISPRTLFVLLHPTNKIRRANFGTKSDTFSTDEYILIIYEFNLLKIYEHHTLPNLIF